MVDSRLMLIQVCLLSESLVTRVDVAHKGTFASVNSQVIEKVMELAEKLLTSREVAVENFDKPLRLRVFVLINGEILGCGDLLLNFEGGDVELVSPNQLYFCFVGYLIP